MQSILADVRKESRAVYIYDRITKLYNLSFRVNGYSKSIERFLRSRALDLPEGARVLDAGCGTGLLTLTMLKMLTGPARITALDLSASSLLTAKRAVDESIDSSIHSASFMRANVLSLPFADETFDLVVTSGVLEYVSLSEGLAEMARVLTPGGYLINLPFRVGLLTRTFEVIFRFRAHHMQDVDSYTNSFFRFVEHHRFPPLDPISWTKTAILAIK
ncbi:MAG: class I SAM-dependent methyltransferase [Pyrinomonadaceae bacterium]